MIHVAQDDLYRQLGVGLQPTVAQTGELLLVPLYVLHGQWPTKEDWLYLSHTFILPLVDIHKTTVLCISASAATVVSEEVLFSFMTQKLTTLTVQLIQKA